MRWRVLQEVEFDPFTPASSWSMFDVNFPIFSLKTLICRFILRKSCGVHNLGLFLLFCLPSTSHPPSSGFNACLYKVTGDYYAQAGNNFLCLMISLISNFEIWCNVRTMQDSFKVIFGFFVPTANFLLFGFIIYFNVSIHISTFTQKKYQSSKIKIQNMCSQYFMLMIQLTQGKNNNQVSKGTVLIQKIFKSWNFSDNPVQNIWEKFLKSLIFPLPPSHNAVEKQKQSRLKLKTCVTSFCCFHMVLAESAMHCGNQNGS